MLCVSGTEIWAAGYDGALYRGNGATWTKVVAGTSTALTSVAATTSHLWVAGSDG